MQTLHLFAGAGGGLLADLILGHTPIGAVEFDPYCCRVLRERAADGWFPELRVHEGDVRLFDPSEYAGRVDCLHAGFPCQPHSVAGKREGEADERNLWPDTKRIIGQLRPRFALLENVPGIVSNGYAAVVVGELSALGYDARWAIISAADVDAPHLRERWWCLAELVADSCENRRFCSGVVPDLDRTQGTWRDEAKWGPDRIRLEIFSGDRKAFGQWLPEPEPDGMVDGVANQVDRLACTGNGQVPLQAALAWCILGGP